MHRCLLLHEVVDLICYHTTYELLSGRRQTLTVLARTCRSFYEPALNYIWYEICNLVPLVQCMPGDLWQVQGEKLIFTRPIIQSDWTRFKEHARRVRIFGSTKSYHRRMWIEEFQVLSVAAGREVLLPNVQELQLSKYHTIPLGTEDNLHFIHLLLGKKLHTIEILLMPNMHSISYLSFLTGLNSRYPSLTDVTVDGIHTMEGLQILSSTVCGWHQLRYLCVSALSTEALIHVASLPSLHDLQLTSSWIDGAPEEFPSVYSTPAFPCLGILRISCHNFTFCISLLQSMSTGSALTLISFRTLALSTPTEWRNLCNLLRNKCSHSSLKSITIEDRILFMDTEEFRGDPLTTDHVLSLLAFTHLTSIRLSTPRGIDISDLTIKDMAMAWPQLKSLHLGRPCIPYLLPKVTLLGLIPLAQYCPRLESLSLAFDATHTPRYTGPVVFSDRLVHLEVFESPITTPAWVAAFLSDIFPNLKDISSDSSMGPDPRWTEVEMLIEVFAFVRSRETARRAFTGLSLENNV